MKSSGKLNPFVNPYGLMRSPWNRNPSEGITRHNATYGMTQYETMPSCSVLRSCFFSRSIERMNDCFNGATHGPVHIKIGGAWGEGDLFSASSSLGFLQNPSKLLLFKVSLVIFGCLLFLPVIIRIKNVQNINEYLVALNYFVIGMLIRVIVSCARFCGAWV